MDIAAASTQLSSAQVQYQASIATLKNAMETTEAIASQMIDQLLNVDVGSVEEHAVDISV